MPNFGYIDTNLLNRINHLVKENASLRQQVYEQQKIMRDIQIHNISKDVANEIEKWMEKPYKDGLTEQQDIKLFAFKITKYIVNRLNDI